MCNTIQSTRDKYPLNTQIAHIAQYKKKHKQSNHKLGRISKWTLFQRRDTDG